MSKVISILDRLPVKLVVDGSLGVIYSPRHRPALSETFEQKLEILRRSIQKIDELLEVLKEGKSRETSQTCTDLSEIHNHYTKGNEDAD